MPIEAAKLKDAPVSMITCPNCGASPFCPAYRGVVQRSRYSWKTLWLPIGKPRPYCTLICSSCDEIVGYESP
jgi:hypothetical protein